MLESLLPARFETVLDVGCNVGASLRWAHRLGARRLLGLDINRGAVAAARDNLADLPGALAVNASVDDIPFPDASVDCVLCLEVIEHVPAELRGRAVAEIRRVLRPGGRLLLTTPHRGLFAWLDPENMRFRLPRLHAVVGRWVGGRGKEAGYEGRKHGVVWHHHFALAELRELLVGRGSDGFEVAAMRGRGCLVFPLGAWLQWPFYRRGRRDHWINRQIERLMAADAETEYGFVLAYDVVVAADRR